MTRLVGSHQPCRPEEEQADSVGGNILLLSFSILIRSIFQNIEVLSHRATDRVRRSKRVQKHQQLDVRELPCSDERSEIGEVVVTGWGADDGELA